MKSVMNKTREKSKNQHKVLISVSWNPLVNNNQDFCLFLLKWSDQSLTKILFLPNLVIWEMINIIFGRLILGQAFDRFFIFWLPTDFTFYSRTLFSRLLSSLPRWKCQNLFLERAISAHNTHFLLISVLLKSLSSFVYNFGFSFWPSGSWALSRSKSEKRSMIAINRQKSP